MMLSEVLLGLLVVVCSDNNGLGAESFSFGTMFQDNMILQREPTAAIVWGYGDLGAEVVVELGEETFNTAVEVKWDAHIWRVTLTPQPAGGPHDIAATQTWGENATSIQLMNVLFGDVWLCSGQSNMAHTVTMVNDKDQEIAAANQYPNIRVMTVFEAESQNLEIDLPIRQNWSEASSESIGGGGNDYEGFSAVCWFFGQALYDELQVPIGLIGASWSATAIEPWTPPVALEKCNLVQDPDDTSVPPTDGSWYFPRNFSSLWNQMIYPLTTTSIKGAIWYQGESNVGYNSYEYACSFPSMIQSWRDSWFQETEQTDRLFPFGFVQLSTDLAATDNGLYPLTRWRQAAKHGYVPNPQMPNTFMAVAMDLGELDSPYGAVHPRYKKDVGVRLAFGALQNTYGRDIESQGPLPISAVWLDDLDVLLTYSEDQTIVLNEISNFEVCCNITSCLFEDPFDTNGWKSTNIVAGDSSLTDDHHIEIDAGVCYNQPSQVPIMVRYCWQLSPCEYKGCQVYNDKDLPSPPFAMSISAIQAGSSFSLTSNCFLVIMLAFVSMAYHF